MNKALFIVTLLAIVGISAAQLSAFATEILALHNVQKMSINYDNYTWSDSLATSAQAWADQLAKNNTFAYSYTSGIGENIATAVSTPNTDVVQTMFNLWMAQKKYFIQWERFPYCSSTGNWMDVGNYTQVVWGASTELGCALSTKGKRNVLVCHYYEPGNWDGNYAYLNKTKPSTTSTTAPTTTTTAPSTTTSSSSTTSTPTTTSSTSTASKTNSSQPWFAAELLNLHNIEKMAINYTNYTWSDSLYQTAQAWADYLASSYNFYHSGTPDVGENIATATIRDTDMVAYMFDLWLGEKKYFIPWKRFPDCSSTGNWGDVAHYTQIVWGMSSELGCGLGVNPENNVLVCQYSLAGNYIGNYVYLNHTSLY